MSHHHQGHFIVYFAYSQTDFRTVSIDDYRSCNLCNDGWIEKSLAQIGGLSYVHHKQPMGGDAGDSESPKNPEWVYPSLKCFQSNSS